MWIVVAVQVAPELVDLYQVIVPTEPDKVNVVPVPVHNVEVCTEILPAVAAVPTKYSTTLLYSEEHAPLVTLALKYKCCVIPVTIYVAAVLLVDVVLNGLSSGTAAAFGAFV